MYGYWHSLIISVGKKWQDKWLSSSAFPVTLTLSLITYF